jgi:hypothetical protein
MLTLVWEYPLITKQDVNVLKLTSSRGEPTRLEQLGHVEGNYLKMFGKQLSTDVLMVYQVYQLALSSSTGSFINSCVKNWSKYVNTFNLLPARWPGK